MTQPPDSSGSNITDIERRSSVPTQRCGPALLTETPFVVLACAFAYTGHPGPRLPSALLAVRFDRAGDEVGRLHLALDGAIATASGPTMETILTALDDFLGAWPVVIHEGARWKRVLARGFVTKGEQRIFALLNQTVDVSEWARVRWPQRSRELPVLLRRLGMGIGTRAVGLERDALALAQLAPRVLQFAELQGAQFQLRPPKLSLVPHTGETEATSVRSVMRRPADLRLV